MESGALARLRALGITSSGFGVTGARHLMESGALRNRERLRIREHHLAPNALIPVLESATRVKWLDLYGWANVEAFARALPPVIELKLSNVADKAISALGRCSAAATIQALHLSSSSVKCLEVFRAFPRLRVLDLRGTAVREPGTRARTLTEALPALRSLGLSGRPPEPVLRIAAHALGPQLEALDLHADSYPRGVIDELRPYIAGEIVETTLEPALL